MATVSFRLRSAANKKVSIYIYVSLGRKEMYQTKTGFSIYPKDWSSSTKKPKQNSEENKFVFSQLGKLEKFVYDEINIAQGKGEVINLYWLKEKLNLCFSRLKKGDSNLFIAHIDYIVENSKTRKIRGSNKIGLSERRTAGYKTFKKIITEYQVCTKREVNFSDINKSFVDHFTNWLINTKEYSINHAGKQISNLKTVCRDAESMEIKVNPYAKNIQGFKERNEDRYIITLSFEELKLIKNAELNREALINARKWLLLGCEIGQRSSDLLELTSENIRYEKSNYYVDIEQQKTKKFISAIILDPDIIYFVENGFPHKISSQKLNLYIKEVCEKAGITDLIQGKKLDKNTQRKKLGYYPKNELISSHSFRRSFATNYYKKMPTPILIQITGHSKESMFLEYINKREDKDENANLFRKFYEELHGEKTSEMKVIRTGSNN